MVFDAIQNGEAHVVKLGVIRRSFALEVKIRGGSEDVQGVCNVSLH